MYNIDFNNKNQRIYFIGIGGISMSGLAEVLLHKGFIVSGSDMKSSPITEKLESLGININYCHLGKNIDSNIDFIVYTSAVKDDNPEIVKAKTLGVPTISRSVLLGQIMKSYDNAIAVAGTHGKTTTTSMLAYILMQSKKDPTISVGGILDAIDGNIRIGHSPCFLTEACEYCDSFLDFFPTIGIILNIEEDHMDYFKDINAIYNSFTKFSSLIPKNGSLIINGDIDNLENIKQNTKCNIVTFGFGLNNDYFAHNIIYNENACASFDLMHKNNNIGKITLNVPGKHNLCNALASIATAISLNISIDNIITGLKNFKGTHRRFEYKGSLHGIDIVDDYAHHPTEIEATLKTAKKMPNNNIYCVFQPHTYTRTKAFLAEFAQSLSIADKIVLTDIYAAREKDTGEIHSLDLLSELKNLDKEVFYYESFDDIENFLLQNCTANDLIITIGAGDVHIIGEDLLGI